MQVTSFQAKVWQGAPTGSYLVVTPEVCSTLIWELLQSLWTLAWSFLEHQPASLINLEGNAATAQYFRLDCSWYLDLNISFWCFHHQKWMLVLESKSLGKMDKLYASDNYWNQISKYMREDFCMFWYGPLVHFRKNSRNKNLLVPGRRMSNLGLLTVRTSCYILFLHLSQGLNYITVSFQVGCWDDSSLLQNLEQGIESSGVWCYWTDSGTLLSGVWCHWIDNRMLLLATARIRNYSTFGNKECQSYDASLMANLTQLVQVDIMDSGRELLLLFF